jgi:molecular chaperone GrpE
MARQPNWPDTDSLLSRLRDWLEETRGEVGNLRDSEPLEAPGEPVGLYQLVEQLTSLRHEVKLLTKTARGGEERTEATLVSMQAAIERFGSIEVSESNVAEQAAKPLVNALADLDESLRRGRQAIENARRRMVEDGSKGLDEARERFEQLYRSQPWWRRFLCRPWHAAVQDVYSGYRLDPAREVFDALLEGYELIQSRLQRSLDEQAILRMQCVGRLVDPHSMTVVEAVRDPGRPPGLVIEEVRTGYYWRTKVLRFAEVKAVGER